MVEISSLNGILIKAEKTRILLDPKISDYTTFISHAHQDHIPEIILKKPFCTEETYDLIKVRNPEFEAEIVKQNKKINFDNFSVEFLSAGHILGSSQIFLELDGTSVLYTGDLKTKNILTAEEYKSKNAEILIIESTYGLPTYRFPSLEDILDQLQKFMENKNRINLIGYQLGKSQDIVKILNLLGIEPNVSKSVEAYCKIYKKFGIDLKYSKDNNEVFVRPTSVLKRLNNKENSILFTGWALTESFEIPALPFSDHCDFYDLIDYIIEVSPNVVYVTHGFSEEFAKEVEERTGIKAFSLENKVIEIDELL